MQTATEDSEGILVLAIKNPMFTPSLPRFLRPAVIVGIQPSASVVWCWTNVTIDWYSRRRTQALDRQARRPVRRRLPPSESEAGFQPTLPPHIRRSALPQS